MAIDEIRGDPTKPGYSKKLKPEFLKAHPTMVVDTRHFGADFSARLIEALGDVDGSIDGLLAHGENRILLLTPNGGLSQQHLREFEAAGRSGAVQ